MSDRIPLTSFGDDSKGVMPLYDVKSTDIAELDLGWLSATKMSEPGNFTNAEYLTQTRSNLLSAQDDSFQDELHALEDEALWVPPTGKESQNYIMDCDKTHNPLRKAIPALYRDPLRGRTICVDPKTGETRGYLRVCAPMVRYSKLPFRQLLRSRNVDIAYCPMILSDVYKNSVVARSNEFLTNVETDNPVVVQFASSNPDDFVDASILVAPHSNGVDLNCGCPQPWAYKERIGSYLMESPQMVFELIRQFKNRVNFTLSDGEPFPIGIKIRIHDDLRRTTDYVRGLVKSNASWITIHGRTRKQRNTDPVNVEAIKHLVSVIRAENPNIPIVANGDLTSLATCDSMIQNTLADGVMAARGLLENPDMFMEDPICDTTRLETISEFNRISTALGGTHFIHHHHLMFMTDKILTKHDKKYFNTLTSIAGTCDYLQDVFGITAAHMKSNKEINTTESNTSLPHTTNDTM